MTQAPNRVPSTFARPPVSSVPPTATAAIDQGVVLEEAGRDIDGDPHTNGAPDIGADER